MTSPPGATCFSSCSFTSLNAASFPSCHAIPPHGVVRRGSPSPPRPANESNSEPTKTATHACGAAPKIRWTAQLNSLPALSVRQPWAWLIVTVNKDIENRSSRTRHRGPLPVHAATSSADLHEDGIAKLERRHGIKLPDEYAMGGIVCVVDVVDCKSHTGSPWHHPGAIGWVLRRPRRLLFRKATGALSLFRPKFRKR
jgi:hypothetical protein